MPISIAGVLLLRAVSPVLSDRSARRFAQDDDSVVGIKNIGSSAKKHEKIEKVTGSQDDKRRVVTLVRNRQIGWTERNSRSLHYASLRPEAVTFLISCGRKAAKIICQ